jgi:Pvc16 N-terminal domain
MSNALAVAAVSFVLVDLLNNGLIDRDISSTGVGDVAVTAWPPDHIDPRAQTQSQLNLFLYQATPNASWRNIGYPLRDATGTRINNPPLALDLHYLLMAYGMEQLHSEILLGYAMQLLHETPILTRDAIRKSLSAPTQVQAGGAGIPAAMLNLFTSELAEQVELIKIIPQILNTEEISKLWTAFQTNYRPTAAYSASVVLIQSKASTKTALPVQHRTVHAIPFQAPFIENVLSQKTAADPIVDGQPILPGYNLVLQGSQLKGEVTSVLVGGLEVFPADTDITLTQIVVAIPPALEAGTQGVQVVQQVLLGSPLVPHRGVESNTSSFVLRPVIQTVNPSGVQGAGATARSGSLNLTVNPPVGPNQRVVLLLNQLPPLTSPPDSPVSYSFVLPPRINLASPPPNPPPPTANITVPFTGVTAGAYLVRLLVDDAESPLGMDANGLYSTPQVTIP